MNDRREDFIPYWLQTGMPALKNIEMPEVMHPWEYPWPHTSPRDIWAELTASNPSVPSPMLPFAAPPGNLDLSTPSWLNTAQPFGADLKQPAWPDPSAPSGRVMQAWEYPWPHTSPMESRLKSPLDKWSESTQPNPSAALPPAVPPAPPLAHLDSGKYWPVAPSVVNEQPPAHGFHVSPVPQAPSWDQVPTYPADAQHSAVRSRRAHHLGLRTAPPPPAARVRQVLASCAARARTSSRRPRILSLAGAAGAELGPGADVSGR